MDVALRISIFVGIAALVAVPFWRATRIKPPHKDSTDRAEDTAYVPGPQSPWIGDDPGGHH